MEIVYGRIGVDGADGTYPNVNGLTSVVTGGSAQSVCDYTSTGHWERVTLAEAIAGNGGSGGDGADAGYTSTGLYYGPGKGGAASNGGSAAAYSYGTTTNIATSIALGGDGGNGGAPGHLLDPITMLPAALAPGGGKGTNGGNAEAVSTDFNGVAFALQTAPFATAISTATAGAGGASYGAGNIGGAGGTVTSKNNVLPVYQLKSYATAGEWAQGGAATATVTQTGGAGGAGMNGAAGGAGALSTLLNAATGYTNGGVLTLTQSAVGGAGGASDGAAGGAAGAATSTLTAGDTTTAMVNGVSTVEQSATVNAASNATGGAAGVGVTSTGVAGAATATLTVSGSGVVNASADATGGAGVIVSGLALATTNATGATGAWSSTSNATLDPGQLVQSVAATTSGVVDGSSAAKTYAIIGGALYKLPVNAQGVSYILGAPAASVTSAILTANSNINSAFSAVTSFFAVAEVGGAYSTNGKSVQTVTSSVSETIDLTQLANPQDLMVGFYSPVSTGPGVKGVTFDLYADGVDVLSQTFSSAAAAKTYFTNNAVDLGSVTSLAQGGSILSLEATMTVTATSASSSFSTSLVVADPPHAAGASVPGLVQAMAGMSAGSSLGGSLASAAFRPALVSLVANTHVA